MLKAFFERRRIRKTLGRYISTDILRELVDGRFTAPDVAYTDRNIEFAFIAVSAPNARTYSKGASIVRDIATRHGGTVHSLLPVVVVAFGSLHTAPSGARLCFVASVHSRLPDAAAIVHGSVAASVGSFGDNTHCDFGFWWPDALDALRQLTMLSPGHVHELQSERNS